MIAAGAVGDTCDFICDDGFEAVDRVDTIVCRADGTFRGGSCRHRSCPLRPESRNGTDVTCAIHDGELKTRHLQTISDGSMNKHKQPAAHHSVR